MPNKTCDSSFLTCKEMPIKIRAGSACTFPDSPRTKLVQAESDTKGLLGDRRFRLKAGLFLDLLRQNSITSREENNFQGSIYLGFFLPVNRRCRLASSSKLEAKRP